ncbi:MAG: hypothetical protein Q9219_001089 [cf. Caloplaca sp. 3 TL-2023]
MKAALYLSVLNTSSEPGHPEGPPINLKLPLNPPTHELLKPRVQYTWSLDPAEVGEIVMSLSTSIYYMWLDIHNEPITQRKEERRIPFPNFVYTVNPGSVTDQPLTPFKLGIAYCWTVEFVFTNVQGKTWPGIIYARILSQYAAWIGDFKIRNLPQTASSAGSVSQKPRLEHTELEKAFSANGTFSTVSQADLSPADRNSALAASDEYQSRWFRCLFRTLLYVYEKHSQDNVADTLPPPSREPNPNRYNFACSTDESQGDEMIIYMYPSAARPENRMSWNVLAKTMLIYGTRVAEDKDGWGTKQIALTRQGVTIGAVAVQLGEMSRNSATA